MTANLSKFDPFKVVGVDHKFAEIVLVLMGDDGDQFDAFGSGFFIAPGLVMTAKHVMEEYWKRYQWGPFPKRKTEIDTRFQVWALNFQNGMVGQGLWYSEIMWISEFTDTAFLYFKPYDENAKNYKCNIEYELTMHAPQSGEKIISFGYPETQVNLIQRMPTVEVEFALQFTRSIGDVRDVHDRLHSRGWIEFSCLETNARFDHGMSGGPVFNPDGQICGVVSGGDGGTEPGAKPSFVALLWPSMLTRLDIDLKTGNSTDPYLVYELFDKGYISQTGWHEVYREKHGQFKPYTDDDGYWRMGWKEGES